MSLMLSTLPAEFSCLRAMYRPTPQEVDVYAQLIADNEGIPTLAESSRLHDEAELQLWVWRSETRQRAATDGRARSARPTLRHTL